MKHLVIILCFLLSVKIMSQEKILTDKEINKLDYLLIDGEISKVKEYLAIKDSLVKAGNYDAEELSQFKKIKYFYDDMFKEIAFRASITPEEMPKYIAQYKLLKNSFEENISGPFAPIAYKKFIDKSDNKEYKEAIKFYTIAYFFKERYINNNNSDIDLNYKLAHKNYRSGKYEDALRLFEYVKSITTDDRLYSAISDSVKYFIKVTKEKIAEEKLVAELWQQKDIVDFNVKFTAGINLNFSPVYKDPDWSLKDNYHDVIKITKIPSTVSMSYTYSGNVYIWKGILIGGQYNQGKIIYTPVTGSYILNMPNCSVTYSAYSAFGKYLFRQEAGLRPYAGLGFGEIKISKSGISGVRDRFYNEFKAAGEDFSSPQYMLQLGIEYIFSKTNNVMFDFVFNILNVPQNHNSITNTYYSACLELGVII